MMHFVVETIAFCMAWCLIPTTPGKGPEPLKPINFDQLNTAGDEDDPFPASDGLQMYYAANAKGKWDILVSSRRARTQPWPAGKLVEGFIRTEADDRSVFLTPEGRYPQYFFFATKKDKLQVANFDIYVAVRQTRRADIQLFERVAHRPAEPPSAVPFTVLVPAFVVGELRVVVDVDGDDGRTLLVAVQLESSTGFFDRRNGGLLVPALLFQTALVLNLSKPRP